MSRWVFLSISACAASIVRSYATFKLVDSDDKTYNLIMMGCWKFIEIAIGIVISCLPILPRLFQGFGSRIYGALSSRFKNSGMKLSGTHTADPSIKLASEKKNSDASVDVSDVRSEVSGQYSPFNEHGSWQVERVVTNDVSRTPLTPTPDRLAPGAEDLQSEKQRGQILRTTRIETEIGSETHAATCFRADLERRQLGW